MRWIQFTYKCISGDGGNFISKFCMQRITRLPSLFLHSHGRWVFRSHAIDFTILWESITMHTMSSCGKCIVFCCHARASWFTHETCKRHASDALSFIQLCITLARTFFFFLLLLSASNAAVYGESIEGETKLIRDVGSECLETRAVSLTRPTVHMLLPVRRP